MKIKFGTVLVALDGQEMKRDKEQPITLGWICAEALLRDQVDKGAEAATRKFHMARRFVKGKDGDLKAEDTVLLKRCVAEQFPTSISGPCLDLLEGKDPQAEEE